MTPRLGGVLLDTNILSELTRALPEPAVIAFVAELDDAWLSIITAHELRFGLALLPEGKRRTELERSVNCLLENYAHRILTIGMATAQWAADLRATAHRHGRVLHLADALIAGTSQAHGLTLATRNTQEFEGLALRLINPWIP